MLKIIAGEVVEKINTCMGHARIAITTDIWTTDKCVDLYIGVTVHFVNSYTKKRNVFRICLRLFNNPHTGINIAKMLKNIFVEFNISAKVFRGLSDNASNMIKGFRDLLELKGNDLEEIEEYSDVDDDDDIVPDFEDDLFESSDSEPEDYENDEEEFVDRYVEKLEDTERDNAEAFRAKNIVRLPCISHKIQLPILKTTKEKKNKFGKIFRKYRKMVKKYNMSNKAKKVLRMTGHKLRLVRLCKNSLVERCRNGGKDN